MLDQAFRISHLWFTVTLSPCAMAGAGRRLHTAERLLEAAVHYDHISHLLTVRTTGAVLDLSSGCYIVGFGKVPLVSNCRSQAMWKLFG